MVLLYIKKLIFNYIHTMIDEFYYNIRLLNRKTSLSQKYHFIFNLPIELFNFFNTSWK